MPGEQAFPRRERLTRQREYRRIYGTGRRVAGRDFVCHVVRQSGQGRKFGLAVPRRVGGAVVRNRVKRYLREVYRTHRNAMAPDVQFVVVARPSAARLDYHACEAGLVRLFRQGGVMGE